MSKYSYFSANSLCALYTVELPLTCIYRNSALPNVMSNQSNVMQRLNIIAALQNHVTDRNTLLTFQLWYTSVCFRISFRIQWGVSILFCRFSVLPLYTSVVIQIKLHPSLIDEWLCVLTCVLTVTSNQSNLKVMKRSDSRIQYHT